MPIKGYNFDDRQVNGTDSKSPLEGFFEEPLKSSTLTSEEVCEAPAVSTTWLFCPPRYAQRWMKWCAGEIDKARKNLK